ncbi:MAG: hypothetical protein ACTTKW_08965 [Schwartzia sp. (in: firmicutes)]
MNTKRITMGIAPSMWRSSRGTMSWSTTIGQISSTALIFDVWDMCDGSDLSCCRAIRITTENTGRPAN